MNPKEQCKVVTSRSGKILEDQRLETNKKTIEKVPNETKTQTKGEERQVNKGKEKKDEKKELPKPY